VRLCHFFPAGAGAQCWNQVLLADADRCEYHAKLEARLLQASGLERKARHGGPAGFGRGGWAPIRLRG
jgi:hypothetical protein